MQVYHRTMSICRVTVVLSECVQVRPLNVCRAGELFSVYQTVVRQFESAQLFRSYKKFAGMRLGYLNVWRRTDWMCAWFELCNKILLRWNKSGRNTRLAGKIWSRHTWLDMWACLLNELGIFSWIHSRSSVLINKITKKKVFFYLKWSENICIGQ